MVTLALGLSAFSCIPAFAAPDGIEEPAAVMELARSHGCLSCHDIKTRVVGPAYEAVAARHKDEPDRVDLMVGKILHGSKGAWGNRVAMPANNVTPEEARVLAVWILSLAPH